MAGQIIKRRDKVWIVRIFTGRDSEGKRRYLNKTIYGTKKDANTYLSATLTAMSAGTFVESSPLTVNAYLDNWLEAAARPRVRERTFTSYEDVLRLYIRPTLGNKKLSDLRPLDLQGLYSDMQARGLSARTIRYAHSVLASALTQAVKWRMAAQNPAMLVELPRSSRKEMEALSPEDVTRFLAEAATDHLGVLFAFALATGLRPSEFMGLQWKDIELGKGIVTVCRTLVRRKGGGWYYGEPKTPRSRRNIPLPASMLRALITHKRQQSETRLKAGEEYQNHDLVFATGDGTPLLLRNIIRRHFRPTLKRAGLPETLRLYDLRHTCATLMLSAGVHPKVASERLGHSSVTLTMDVYSHVLPSMQQDATEKLESILFG
jgi:integrase